MNMGTLFKYELKKILSRKMIWILLLTSAALILYQNMNAIASTLGGFTQGMRDTYRIYEGRVITQASAKEAKAAFEQFALSHSDHFTTRYDENQGTVFYFAKDYNDYYGGVAFAYIDLSYCTTVENLQQSAKDAQDTLQQGSNADGSSLSPSDKQALEAQVKNGFDTPVVHYMEGWKFLGRMPADGLFALFLLVLGLLPLFSQESSSRMEGVLLCAVERHRAAMAKMLAAAAFALGVPVLIYGFETLVLALTYGLDGASVPISTLYEFSFKSGGRTVGGLYALVGLAVIAAAMASAALIALSSSLFRNPVLSLLFTAALIAVQFLSNTFLTGIAFRGNSINLNHLQQFINLLPAPALINVYTWIDSMRDADLAAFALAFPALLTSLLFWLAPRHYLKQRKA